MPVSVVQDIIIITIKKRYALMKNHIGETLEKINMKTCELAELCGVSPANLVPIKKGYSKPSYATAVKISQALGKTVGEIFPKYKFRR